MSLPPPPVTNCHTFLDPPSSVTYFLDSPYYRQTRWRARRHVTAGVGGSAKRQPGEPAGSGVSDSSTIRRSLPHRPDRWRDGARRERTRRRSRRCDVRPAEHFRLRRGGRWAAAPATIRRARTMKLPFCWPDIRLASNETASILPLPRAARRNRFHI